MKYLALALSLVSVGAMADTNGTSTVTETSNSIENTNAPTFVAPLTMGGGDVLASYNTLTETSATCASNQFILEAVNTTSRLRGSGAPKIGNYGYAFSGKLVMPWGDDGRCERRAEIVNKNAAIDYARNTHNLCMGAGASFKAANPKVYLDDDFFYNNESYRPCREIFAEVLNIAHKLQ